jgi:hypothetical protein
MLSVHQACHCSTTFYIRLFELDCYRAEHDGRTNSQNHIEMGFSKVGTSGTLDELT